MDVKRHRTISRYLSLMLAVLVAAAAGCASPRQPAAAAALQTPLPLKLGEAGAPLGPVAIRSGQWIALSMCCPPVELRDARGGRIRDLKYTRDPQPLVLRAGNYSIVGHDPAGGECVVRLRVTKD